jgi:hypothetical protein
MVPDVLMFERTSCISAVDAHCEMIVEVSPRFVSKHFERFFALLMELFGKLGVIVGQNAFPLAIAFLYACRFLVTTKGPSTTTTTTTTTTESRFLLLLLLFGVLVFIDRYGFPLITNALLGQATHRSSSLFVDDEDVVLTSRLMRIANEIGQGLLPEFQNFQLDETRLATLISKPPEEGCSAQTLDTSFDDKTLTRGLETALPFIILF